MWKREEPTPNFKPHHALYFTQPDWFVSMERMDTASIKVATEAAKELGLSELVPAMYQDVLQPAARETGQKLVIVAKAVGVALAPLEGLVWGYEQTKAYLAARVVAKLANKPPDQIQSPDKTIAGPLLISLAFAADVPHLKELYANLLASAMHSPTANRVHPSFVHVIQQLTPAEARILKFISLKATTSQPLFTEKVASLMTGVESQYSNLFVRRLLAEGEEEDQIPRDWNRLCKECEVTDAELAQTFLTNFIRLGILVETLVKVKDPNNIRHMLSSPETDDQGVLKRELRLTNYGNVFLNLCVRDDPLVGERKTESPTNEPSQHHFNRG